MPLAPGRDLHSSHDDSEAFLKAVSERLGHSDVRTTLRIYVHVIPSIREETTRRIDQLGWAQTLPCNPGCNPTPDNEGEPS